MNFKLDEAAKKETISVYIKELLPELEKSIRKQFNLDDSVELHMCSNTDFLLFGVVRDGNSVCACADCKRKERDIEIAEKLCPELEHIKGRSNYKCYKGGVK